ncbi:MAG: hypothetical protein B7C24_09005 [Bacteroidetes bacterium 4572_77]|nr:MAG: hypothetical protein B7C24_09005 [Bacteroidetes bacterium 4572_77]
MADLTKIKEINAVIEAYFAKNTSVKIVPAKELMAHFISAHIFGKDHRNGLPIRKILRALDKSNQLQLIPYVYAERKDADTYWYFIPSSEDKPATPYKQQEKKAESKQTISSRANSDETYVIDLCDMVLEKKANRQKRFDFLLGDLHKDKKTRTKLPVDAYYESLNLVVEYMEKQHTEEVKHFDKPDKTTVSGVSRGEQRRIYDERRKELIPKNGIDLIIIDYSQLSHNSSKQLLRDKENDIAIIKTILKKYAQTK